MNEPVNLDDFEALARAKMDPGAFDYIAGGSTDEITLRDNVGAFARRRLRPRVLVDVSRIDTSSQMLGTDVSMPIGLTPTALQRLAHPDGELAAARAAERAGLIFGVSTMSSYALEEVALQGPAPKWFQLYVYKDRALSEALLKRAVFAGYKAIILTVDLPVPGYRERDLRNRFLIPEHAAPGNFVDLDTADQELLTWIAEQHTQSLTWEDVGWVRMLSDLPLVLKGVLTAEDAALAVEHGADAITVSNHGGRQLDRSPAALDVLEEVVEAVEGRAEVYLDGGVRRGADILIALALGAKGVFLGRPYLYALAADGEEGVVKALSLLRAELENAMALLGVRNISEVTPDHLF